VLSDGSICSKFSHILESDKRISAAEASVFLGSVALAAARSARCFEAGVAGYE